MYTHTHPPLLTFVNRADCVLANTLVMPLHVVSEGKRKRKSSDIYRVGRHGTQSELRFSYEEYGGGVDCSPMVSRIPAPSRRKCIAVIVQVNCFSEFW